MRRVGWGLVLLGLLAFLFQWNRPESQRDEDDRLERVRRAGL